MKNQCLIVFPLYKTPNATELAFLENGLRLLNGFDAVIAGPESLDTSTGFGLLKALKVVRFNEAYFASIKGYNQLLLAEEFYQKFAGYEYILIHQADVYIFKDTLANWCEKRYAYIGAPWFRAKDNLFKQAFNVIRKSFNNNYGRKHNKVGNGGLSLRRVRTALNVLASAPEALLSRYRDADHHTLNEDVFWSLEAPVIDENFNIPDFKEALHFAVEFNPEQALILLNNELPFGCHAPIVHGKAFWSKYIPAIK